eukprot:Platyproteum_vivax@DN1462_c0_g1_i1.p1
MSSLAAARADNFYYGTAYGAGKGTFNQYRGSHGALGKRANMLHLGILIIRFEMPFNVRCKNCRTMIAKGVRYNAQKKCQGQYHSTKIYSFRMTCFYCPQKFVITTDPQKSEYILTEGLERKIETWNAKDAEQIELLEDEDRQRMRADPMYKLEKTTEDKERASAKQDALENLLDIQDSRADYYSANSDLRARHRVSKKEEISRLAEEEKHKNFILPLLPASEEDAREAKLQVFHSDPSIINHALKRTAADASSIFKKTQSKDGDGIMLKKRKLALARNPKNAAVLVNFGYRDHHRH